MEMDTIIWQLLVVIDNGLSSCHFLWMFMDINTFRMLAWIDIDNRANKCKVQPSKNLNLPSCYQLFVQTSCFVLLLVILRTLFLFATRLKI